MSTNEKWFNKLSRRGLLILVDALEESRNRERKYAAQNIKILTRITCRFCKTTLDHSCKECGIADIKKEFKEWENA